MADVLFSFREAALAGEKGVIAAVERPGTRFVFERMDLVPRGFLPANDDAETMYRNMALATGIHPDNANPDMMFKAINAVATFVTATGGKAYDAHDPKGDQPTRAYPSPYFVIETRGINQPDPPTI